MRNCILIGLSVFLASIFWSCTKHSPENKAAAIPTETVNDLPKMTVKVLNGSEVDIRSLKGKTVLILFQPDCDHCQREAREIREHIDAFKGYSVYFISADLMPSIEKFGNDYDLLGQSNIHFALTTVDNVINSFGSIPAPSVYIYSNQKLKQKFNGEVSIEKILQAI